MQTNLKSYSIAAVLLTGLAVASLTGGDETGVLGPVDSIEFGSGDDAITLTNRDKHLAFGEETTSTVWSVGFMEVGKALGQLMQAAHFIEARDELKLEIEDLLAEGKSVLDEIMEEARALEPDAEDAPAMRQRWEQAYSEFQQLQQLAAEQQGAQYAAQMAEAYEEIVDAVDVVAERQNIDMVLRFIKPDQPFESNNPDATITQIRMRTALKYPEGIDITDDVLAELGLDAQ